MAQATDKSSTTFAGVFTSLHGEDCGRHFAIDDDGTQVALSRLPRSQRRQVLARYHEKHGVHLQPPAG